MSARSGHDFEERLLTFEIGAAAYALPIAGVLEVTEAGASSCVPTLPPGRFGVLNLHGDALPVVDRAALLGVDAPEPAAPQLLVVSARPPEGARLGLVVDRVLGLIDGRAARAAGADPVAERRNVEGRLTRVLDAERLVARARQVIESSSAESGR